MSNSVTYNECIEIINDKKSLNHKQLQEKWDSFKLKFPQLYQMLTLENNIDLQILKYLCETAEKHNEKTKNEKIEQEFEVGETLAQKYIYDKFPEPSNQQKEFIKETLRKKLENGQDFANKDSIFKSTT